MTLRDWMIFSCFVAFLAPIVTYISAKCWVYGVTSTLSKFHHDHGDDDDGDPPTERT